MNIARNQLSEREKELVQLIFPVGSTRVVRKTYPVMPSEKKIRLVVTTDVDLII